MSHKMYESYVPVPVQFYDLAPGRRIAYRHFVGTKEPTIVYIPGFFSSMELRKIIVLEQYARGCGFSFIRYDQECTGQSTGSQETIEFEHWLEDALAIVDHHAKGPIILVASSLGAWISTLITQKRPERIKGMLWIGPGFNALYTGYWHYYNQLPADVREKVDSGEDGGHIKIKMAYGGWGILRRDFCENTLAFEVDFENELPIDIPIRTIHGIRDKDIPYEFVLMAMEKFATKDFEVVYRKMGDHRLMTEQDLNLITYELDRLIHHIHALDAGLKAAPILRGTDQEDHIAEKLERKLVLEEKVDTKENLKSKL